jgi:hypothetical protein
VKLATPFHNKIERTRFWLLIGEAVVSSILTAQHHTPSRVSSTSVGQWLSSFPILGVTGLYLSIVVMMLVGVTVSYRFLRIAHAYAVFHYTLIGLAQILLMVVGEPTVQNGVHNLIVAWLHYNAGVDLPPLSEHEYMSDGETNDVHRTD